MKLFVVIYDNEKRVLVKCHLKTNAAHHIFEDEQLCSAVLEIARYKWHDNAMERIEHSFQDNAERGASWTFVYKIMIDHYKRNGRFNWEKIGIELVWGNRSLSIFAQQRDVQVALLTTQLVSANAETTRLRDAVDGRETQVNNLERQSIALSADLSTTQEAFSRTREELLAAHQSYSWGIALPLRYLLSCSARRARPLIEQAEGEPDSGEFHNHGKQRRTSDSSRSTHRALTSGQQHRNKKRGSHASATL